MSAGTASARWVRAMPAVFVLIWSTGFIVARYGVPNSPALKFLVVRYILSALCLAAWAIPGAGHLWLGRRAKGVVFFGAPNLSRITLKTRS